MTKKKKILITGFEPFDGSSFNPSAQLLEWLNLQTFDFELHTLLLPVSFTQAFPLLEEMITKINPSAVVLTGYAQSRLELTIERIGINWVDARIPDNDGLLLKAQKIVNHGPDGLFTTLPVLQLIETAKESGCPAKVSTSAGEYVCNHLLYLYLSKYSLIPGTFIHLPAAQNNNIFFQGIHAIVSQI
jgi:pyroglutamyl-peptidase